MSDLKLEIPNEVLLSIDETTQNEIKRIDDLINSSRVVHNTPPEKPNNIISIGGQSVLTQRNFMTISGHAKAGKTAFIRLMLADMFGSNEVVTCENPNMKVVWFDTEMTDYDVWLLTDSLVSMGVSLENIEFFQLRQYDPLTRKSIIKRYLETNPAIDLAIIDGIRDLVYSINDESEATETMTFLMNLTATLNCGIMVVLHQNKSNDMLRGHIGTECINKAESVVSVSFDKEKGQRIAKAEQTRKQPFEDVYFEFNDKGNPEFVEAPKLIDKTNWTTERQTTIISDAKRAFPGEFTKSEILDFIQNHQLHTDVDLKRKALETCYNKYFLNVGIVGQIPNKMGVKNTKSKIKFITL
jgi:hypothetical protein